jgi:hypothetical protein
MELLLCPQLEEEMARDFAHELHDDSDRKLSDAERAALKRAVRGVVRTIQLLYVRTTPNRPRKAP